MAELTKAEKFFVEQHRHLSAKEIAKELGKRAKTIESYLATLPALEKPKRTEPKTHFAAREGSVIMTEAQSHADDATAKLDSKKAFLANMKDSIHIINPDLPVY